MSMIDALPYFNFVAPLVLAVIFIKIYLLTGKINALTLVPAFMAWFMIYAFYLYDVHFGVVIPGEHQLEFRTLYAILALSFLIYGGVELHYVYLENKAIKEINGRATY